MIPSIADFKLSIASFPEVVTFTFTSCPSIDEISVSAWEVSADTGIFTSPLDIFDFISSTLSSASRPIFVFVSAGKSLILPASSSTLPLAASISDVSAPLICKALRLFTAFWYSCNVPREPCNSESTWDASIVINAGWLTFATKTSIFA